MGYLMGVMVGFVLAFNRLDYTEVFELRIAVLSAKRTHSSSVITFYGYENRSC